MISRDPDPSPLDAAAQRDLIERAERAARSGDALETISLLVQARYLDAVVRRLAGPRQYQSVGWESLEEAVSDASLSLFEAIQAGKLRESAAGYLWKTAQYNAYDAGKDQARERDAVAELIKDEKDDLSVGRSREAIHARVLPRARAALPLLGGQRVQQVMELIFDSIEAGEPITNDEIAETLDVTSDVVRKSKERGFKRLERVVNEDLDDDPVTASDK